MARIAVSFLTVRGGMIACLLECTSGGEGARELRQEYDRGTDADEMRLDLAWQERASRTAGQQTKAPRGPYPNRTVHVFAGLLFTELLPALAPEGPEASTSWNLTLQGRRGLLCISRSATARSDEDLWER